MDEVIINFNSVYELQRDEEFLEYFIQNFETILDNTGSFPTILIEECCEDKKLRAIIMENISEVIEKTEDRQNLLYIMYRHEIKENIQQFFSESYALGDVNYYQVISIIEDRVGLSRKDTLSLVLKNIDNIFQDSGIYASCNGENCRVINICNR